MRIFNKILIPLLVVCGCSRNNGNIVLKKMENFDKLSKYFVIIPNDSSSFEEDTIKVVARLELYQNKNVFKIETELFKKKYGHYFFFNTNGNLLDFKYLTDDNHFSYGIEYDYINKIFTETGTPYVDHMEYISLNERKIFFNFSTFPRSNLEVSISKDSMQFEKVKLQNSTFMPLVSVYEYKATKEDSVVYFKVKASDPIVDLKNLPSAITRIIKVEF